MSSRRPRKLPKKPSERRPVILNVIPGAGESFRDYQRRHVDMVTTISTSGQGEKALVLCAPVGSIRHFPEGCRPETTKCVGCGRALWIDSENKRAIERRGYRVVAHCVPGHGCATDQRGGGV